MATRRLLHELNELNNDESLRCSAQQTDNIYEWNVSMQGPQQTPYECGLFNIKISRSSI